jgi:hypothetical protein
MLSSESKKALEARRVPSGGACPGVLIGQFADISTGNVSGKRAAHASELRTPPNLHTSLISTYNGSTQRYSDNLK